MERWTDKKRSYPDGTFPGRTNALSFIASQRENLGGIDQTQVTDGETTIKRFGMYEQVFSTLVVAPQEIKRESKIYLSDSNTYLYTLDSITKQIDGTYKALITPAGTRGTDRLLGSSIWSVYGNVVYTLSYNDPGIFTLQAINIGSGTVLASYETPVMPPADRWSLSHNGLLATPNGVIVLHTKQTVWEPYLYSYDSDLGTWVPITVNYSPVLTRAEGYFIKFDLTIDPITYVATLTKGTETKLPEDLLVFPSPGVEGDALVGGAGLIVGGKNRFTVTLGGNYRVYAGGGHWPYLTAGGAPVAYTYDINTLAAIPEISGQALNGASGYPTGREIVTRDSLGNIIDYADEIWIPNKWYVSGYNYDYGVRQWALKDGVMTNLFQDASYNDTHSATLPVVIDSQGMWIPVLDSMSSGLFVGLERWAHKVGGGVDRVATLDIVLLEYKTFGTPMPVFYLGWIQRNAKKTKI